jgi:putative photosynthetic complex assembly protein 2
MGEPIIVVAIVVLAWWASTGALLRMVWSSPLGQRRALVLTTVLGLAGVGVVIGVRDTATVGAAYAGFAAALAMWAWHELAFLLGVVAGPRREPCRAEARGMARFVDAAATVIHHELALAATLAGLIIATWGARNQVATGTFLVLWVMRLSAKLILFSGARSINEEFVPPRIRYLTTYFRHRRFNPLVLVSLVASSIALYASWVSAATEGIVPFASVAATLLATLVGLGMLEHAFLALPLDDARLWRWLLRRSALPASTSRLAGPRA